MSCEVCTAHRGGPYTLILHYARSAIRHGKRHRALDRVAHTVQGLTPSTLPRFGRRPGEAGTAEDFALPEDAFLGYLPPGGVLRDGDRYVRRAEAHLRRRTLAAQAGRRGVSLTALIAGYLADEAARTEAGEAGDQLRREGRRRRASPARR